MGDVATASASAKAKPDTACDATNPGCPAKPVSKVTSAYFAIKKEGNPPKGKKTPVSLTLQKITNAVIESKVLLVIETSELAGGKISVEILGSDATKIIVDKDAALSVLQAGAAQTTLTADVGNWSTKTEYSNAASLKDKAIIEIELKPGTKTEEIDPWRTAIGKADPKRANFYLKVTATGGTDTEYTVEDETLTSPSKEKGVFLNKKDQQFQLHACYCKADLSIDVLKSIGISASKATEFLDAINKTFTDYHLDSCLKKIHFIAQAAHESGGFRLTKEGGVAETEYGGFIGRGLIQITGKGNYTDYGTYEKEDFTSSDEKKKQLESLPYSARSAGWFWDVKASLNPYAVKNDFIHITRLINGGFNGYNDRLNYIKNGFKYVYKNCQNDTGKTAEFTFTSTTTASWNEARASFAWGLWHDPNAGKHGCTTDKTKAIAGYERFLALVSETYAEVDWYNIKAISSISDLKYKSGPKGKEKEHIKVRAAAEKLLKALKDAK